MAQFEEVAKQFVEFYYQTFDTNRVALANLYKDNSMLTFESEARRGAQSILEKLASLPFQKVQHHVTTLDAQPSSDVGGIMVLVTGGLKVDDETKLMSYVQCFQLLPDGAGSYYVFNDIFKLVFPAS